MAVAALGVIVGCAANSPPPPVDPLAGAPAWVTRGCRVHWQDEATATEIVCGIGSAGPNRNPLTARETAVARARSVIARSIKVTVESFVRLESNNMNASEDELRSIVHQLTSTSLPACRVESTWQSPRGEIFALVSLSKNKLRQSLGAFQSSSHSVDEDLARKAAIAFGATKDPSRDEPTDPNSVRPSPE